MPHTRNKPNPNQRGKSSQHSKWETKARPKWADKKKKWKLIEEEVESVTAKYSEIQPSNIQKFTDFPLSSRTQGGLKVADYKVPTEIQRESIGLALQGHDILGAAKTGSGKTLAFLIPVLETLYRLKWSAVDGLGALIISPTRELAYQTFEVLRKIGKKHDFSAGLVIGGKLLKNERERINRTNIVICTPGRLLQHMDETAYFGADNLKVLVLDEADRILDLGFRDTMNAIIDNLPSERQTLLYSATQTKSVKDLARLSLKEPMYVSVHEHAKHSTPTQLQQSYIVCELHQKLDLIWSFVQNHRKKKILIFLSSCKQVRFFHDAFCRLRPGMTVLALHGAMKQLQRVDVYEQFCRKQNAVLFATDIAARGLDFPAVHWVVQLDCPEDANTYIHRVGRTARFEKEGESLCVLLPSEEEAMVELLNGKKIPINKIKVNPKKLWSIQGKLEALCASDVTFKECAQRAFVSYVRSVFLMSNKKVFQVNKLDTDQYARAIGLAIPPRIRFLQKEQKRLAAQQQARAAKIESSAAKALKESTKSTKSEDSEESDGSESSEEEDSDEEDAIMQKIRKSADADSESENSESGSEESDPEENNQNISDTRTPTKQTKTKDAVTSKSKRKLERPKEVFNFDADKDDDDDEDDLFTVKRLEYEVPTEEDKKNKDDEEDVMKKKEKQVTRAAMVKKLQKKNLQVNTKVVFDEEGQAVQDRYKKSAVREGKDYEGGINIAAAKHRMQQLDKEDKVIFQERIRKKHREERLKEKEKRRKKPRHVEEEEAQLDQDEPDNSFMDYIPDPDLVYGKDKDDDSKSSEGEETDDEESGPPKKRTKVSNEEASEESSSEEMEGGDFDTGLTLEDDEALALKLLQT